MSPAGLLVIYCLLIVLASLAGGWIPLLIRLTHARLETALSFVSGVMLGAALLHMLPHAWLQQAASANIGAGGGPLGHEVFDPVVLWLLAGFLTMFFIERFFCFHQHETPQRAGESDHAAHHRHELTWGGAAIGLTIHSIIAGVALGASVTAEAESGGNGYALAGLGTFLAIALHKPFDSMTLGTLMAAGRRSKNLRHVINVLFGLMVPLGVVGFAFGAGGAPGSLLSAALAFSAGTFLCIALSDLLPELQFHQHDRIKLSLALLLGLAVAWSAGQLE
ncbi:MAG: ZIP family metal transporter [Planctomycetota bacterium]|jgi:zinc and cadmium transporter